MRILNYHVHHFWLTCQLVNHLLTMHIHINHITGFTAQNIRPALHSVP